MIYVIIYPQKEYRDRHGFSISVAKKFRSIKLLMDYCYERFKPNYIIFEESCDASFDYFIHLRNRID